MGNRWVRAVVVILVLATLGFAGNQIRLSDQTLAAEQSRERVFTDLGWNLTHALADLRSAQKAYVADGQDHDFWTDEADAHFGTVFESIENLKQVADLGTLDELDEAAAVVSAIRELDDEVREYIATNQPLQASDEIFKRGDDLFDNATAQARTALQAERTSRIDVMTAARSTQDTMMWTATAVIVLAMLVLAPLNASPVVSPPDADEDEAPESTGLSLLSLNGESAVDDLRLPPADAAAGEAATVTASRAASPAAGEPVHAPAAQAAAPDINATAALCTDFSNVTDRNQLPELLARTAALMNASGLIVWVSDVNAQTLQPALGHGYAPGTLERIGSISQRAANPTSVAFTTRRIQIVASDDADTGALAAPLMVADRCTGVLSAELRNGWESIDAVQATASIVAAQLAPLLPAEAAPPKPLPAAATGTHDAAATGTHDQEGAETITPPPPRGAGR